MGNDLLDKTPHLFNFFTATFPPPCQLTYYLPTIGTGYGNKFLNNSKSLSHAVKSLLSNVLLIEHRAIFIKF